MPEYHEHDQTTGAPSYDTTPQPPGGSVAVTTWAVGLDSGAADSTDGVTFDHPLALTIAGDAATAIQFNGTEWLATTNAGLFKRAAGAAIWTPITNPLPSVNAIRWSGIAGGTWVLGSFGDPACIAYGPSNPAADGSDWTVATTPWDDAGALCGVNGLAWDGTNLMAVGLDAAGAAAVIYSADLVTWHVPTTALDAGTVSGVTTSGALWVVAGANAGGTRSLMTATSADPTTWTARTSPLNAAAAQSVYWDGTQFWAGGTTGKLAKSTDGATWTDLGSPFGSVSLNGFEWNGSHLALVAGSVALAVSSDRTTFPLALFGTVVNSPCAKTRPAHIPAIA